MVGSLGATEGPPVTYNWGARGLLPPLLPWLAILGFLALKPNRGWSAWWIWVALASLAVGGPWLQLGLPRLPDDVVSVFIDVPRALTFGLAALWLLAPYVGRGRRFGTFLRMLCVLAVFGAFSFAVTAGWSEGAAARLAAMPGGGFPAIAAWAGGVTQMVLLTTLALVITTAMALNGLVCRGRSLPWLCLGFAGSLLAVLFAAVALVYVFVRVTSPGGEPSFSFLGIGLLVSVLSLATLLPFLVLSFASALFRERLKTLFSLELQPPAPGLREAEKWRATTIACTSTSPNPR